uniref:Uncharacterized protein n=1 Tax=Avena sativa TaxID=4498 RepID=A0ACD5VEE2_AVESA
MGDGLRIGRESGKKRREGGSCGGDADGDGDRDGDGDEQMVSVGSNCGIIALEALDCTVCNNPLRPPIFQCATGHVICWSCHLKLRNKNKCYVCSITGGYQQRCIALEKILESIQTPCSNTMYVDPHAVAGDRRFRCLVRSTCRTASWRSDFRTISTNLSDGLPTEDGSYSLVVPALSCYSGINVTISKVSGL